VQKKALLLSAQKGIAYLLTTAPQKIKTSSVGRKKKPVEIKRKTVSARILPALDERWKGIAKTTGKSKGAVLEGFLSSEQTCEEALREGDCKEGGVRDLSKKSCRACGKRNESDLPSKE
jgi:hypothetical protein